MLSCDVHVHMYMQLHARIFACISIIHSVRASLGNKMASPVEEMETDFSENESTQPLKAKKRTRKTTSKARNGEISNEHFLASMKDSKLSTVNFRLVVSGAR